MAAGLREDEVDDGVRWRRYPLAQYVRRAGLHAGAVERAEDDRRSSDRQRRAEIGHAVGPGPGAVGDDEHADVALGQRGEASQVLRGQEVGVVDEESDLGVDGVVGGQVMQHDAPGPFHDIGERVEQDGSCPCLRARRCRGAPTARAAPAAVGAPPTIRRGRSRWRAGLGLWSRPSWDVSGRRDYSPPDSAERMHRNRQVAGVWACGLPCADEFGDSACREPNSPCWSRGTACGRRAVPKTPAHRAENAGSPCRKR